MLPGCWCLDRICAVDCGAFTPGISGKRGRIALEGVVQRIWETCMVRPLKMAVLMLPVHLLLGQSLPYSH